MAAGVRVSFGVVEDEISPTLKNNVKGYKASKRAIQEIQGTYRKFETDAVRALKKTADATSKLNRIQTGLNDLVDRNVISEKRAAEVMRQTRDQLDGTAAARKKDAALVEQTRRRLSPILTAQKAIVRQLKEGNISRREAKRLVEGIRSSTVGVEGATRGWTASLQSTLTTYFGIHQAIQTATQLIEAQREAERKGAEETITIAKAQEQLVRNTAGFSDADRASLVQETNELAGQVPTATRAAIFDAVGFGISATNTDERGDRGRIEDILGAAGSAARLNPNSPENIRPLTEAILDLGKATKGVVSKEEATELLLRSGAQSRITDTVNLGNLVPALQAIRVVAEKQGEFEREDITTGLGLQAVLSSLIVDKSGEITRTAISKLAKTLGEIVPEDQAKGFADQIEFIRDPKNAAIRQEVVDNLEGRGIAKPSIEAILLGVGSGSALDPVVEAITREGTNTVEAVRSLTPELRNAGNINEARAGSTDLVQSRFGRDGAIREQAIAAFESQGASGYIPRLNFELARLFVGTEQAANRAVENMISAEQRDISRMRGDEKSLQVLEQIRDNIRGTPRKEQAVPPEVN